MLNWRDAKSLGLSDEAAAVAAQYPLSDVEDELQSLLHDEVAFFHRNDAFDDAPQRYLALFTHFALRQRETYRLLHIPDQVYFDTFADIARWECEYARKTGKHGIDEQRWLARHVQLRLFALGQLQFEPLEQPEFPLPDGLASLPCLNVHIPKGADLKFAEASFQAALGFWQLEHAVAVCHSWLLSPALSKLLRSDSNILRFQRMFEVVGLDDSSRQAEERIFGDIRPQPADYPVSTSLQRAARQWLLDGNPLPSAYGYRHLQPSP